MKVLHRLRFVLLAVTGVILVIASVITLRDGGRTDPDEVRGHLGPTPGPNSNAYVAAKKAYLNGLASTEPLARSAALVSLQAYAPAPDAQRFARDMKPIGVWVRLPASTAELILVKTTISGAVADAAAAHRKVLDAEVEELRAQAGKAEGDKKTSLDKLVAERKASLAKVRSDCRCVFAFSVEEATLGDLKQLQERPAVRVVDVPDPVTNELSGWELQPIVPSSG